MWALRRASNPLKFRGFALGTSRISSAKSEIFSGYIDGNTIISESPQAVAERCLFYHTAKVCSNFSMGNRSLSSQAGSKSSESESDSDGFSELERPVSEGSIASGGNEDELVSEPELSDNDEEETGIIDTLETTDKDKTNLKRQPSELSKAIIDAPGQSVSSVFDKWVEEGKSLDQEEILKAMLSLRRRRMYGKALLFSEWLEAKKKLDFTERDYASRLDLIGKVRGFHKAESYIEKIPASFRGEVIYRTLLAACVSKGDLKKAEQVFNNMKDLQFPVTSFSCNQLLLLYKRLDKKKIADVLLLMEKENIKPTLFTYKLLIDTKGQSNDLTGMDQIVETMKAEGLEPDIKIQAILARHYVSGGLKEKAEAVLKEMEGGDLKEHRGAAGALLPLYAALGKADEVERIWKLCKSKPRLEECMAAIEAWGKLKRVDEAEAVFNKMEKTWDRLSSKHYTSLLKVYAEHKLVNKGKNLVKRMGDSGCRIGPLTWDALVKLYVQAGEVEKADAMLQKVVEQSLMKPLFSSFITIMEQYSKRGDVHNAEKIFHRMKLAGYVARHRQFQCLVQTYINAKTPAYGMRERMKADNIFPSKSLANGVVQVDAFKKTAVSHLLD